MSEIDRRAFLIGTGALGLAACAAPERDLLDAYEDVDIPLEPGPTTLPSNDGSAPDTTVSAVPDPTGAAAGTPMEQLIASIEPPQDRIGVSFVARAPDDRSEVPVYAAVGDAEPAWTFANPIDSGGSLVFLVDDFDGIDHYRVLLPIRPNGSFGWVHKNDVDVLRHNHAIRVDLDNFTITVFDHEQEVLSTTVGVARDNAPTPRGRYYTTEVIRPTTPDSVYGAFAYGLSGFSDTFVSFNGGPGQLGIHGTNDPSTIGTTVSSGCVRLTNEDITFMVEELEVRSGVPVEVI
ncbi:MAG: L,D-transpeptidase [Acidimicrobiales bacterium]|nr:L,D-transpeptidase [Acidimicrobiales bacterium]